VLSPREAHEAPAPIGQKAQPAAAGGSRKAAKAVTTMPPASHPGGHFFDHFENEPRRAHIGRMAREKYESMLRCPMCGRTGLADMSDDKSHKIGDYDARVEAVTQGFEIKGKDAICSACQVSAL
jgi:hypothetical protein